MQAPLAERLRPRTIEEYIGQTHLVGDGSILRRMIDTGHVASFILWGPPGVGKTTLARIIANTTESPFYTLSAVHSGVKEVREVLEQCKADARSIFSKGRPILFIDEIHRFNKSQQDSLLGAVAQVYVLKPLEEEQLQELLQRAITTDEILKKRDIKVESTTALFRFSGGDARKLLNILDLLDQSTPQSEPIVINDEVVTNRLQENPAAYDKSGEMHYDIISAFIKSIRGSDPDAAVYWLARLIAGGEDPKFIARRLVILAAEDIGLANPNALLLANATFDTIHKIGWPEGRIPLSECAIYLATSPKSNSAYMAIDAALSLVERTGNLPVPLHLRNAPTKLMKELDYGKNYKYAHDYPGNFVRQEFMPEELEHPSLWKPGENQSEAKLRALQESRWGKKN